VRNYARIALPGARQLLTARLASGVSARSVQCGRHAFDLAESLTAEIRRHRDRGSRAARRIHLFMAAPGAFSFFLGQRQVALGSVTLYEFDFEGSQGASYQPSLDFPIAAAE